MSLNLDVSRRDVRDLATDIVAAYVSNNNVPSSELPALLTSVHESLARLTSPSPEPEVAVDRPTPAQIRKSVTPDALISFEDGKAYKTLKRHLTKRGLTPEEYRAKYGLPNDYPMTAKNYSERRSQLAHSLGLGQQRRKTAG